MIKKLEELSGYASDGGKEYYLERYHEKINEIVDALNRIENNFEEARNIAIKFGWIKEEK